MQSEYFQNRLEEIKETIKELRFCGSDIARAKRAIAHEQFILEGVSRKRDPVPWALAQFRLASSLAIIAGKARDIPKLRKAVYRLEKARRIFQHAGYEDAVQKCEVLLAQFKELLGKLGDKGKPFDPNRASRMGEDLEPEGQENADDLADRLRRASGSMDRTAAMRGAEALRHAREADELAARDAIKERTRTQERQKRDRDRGRGSGISR
jgi:hypothetical protein